MKMQINKIDGMLNEPFNWQYDPLQMFKCTIGNQFEILMLIERLEHIGVHCISANTDGITCLFDRSLLNKYYKVCHKWEEDVGNKELGQLEYMEYKKMFQESVNSYIMIEANGELKIKGRFAKDVELVKNNTSGVGRIERLAIQKYVEKGTSIENTIRNHKNIYDFCIGVKSSKHYHFSTTDNRMKQEAYQRVVRFYVSNEGVRLFKIKNKNSEATGPQVSKVAGEHKVTIFNRYFKKDNFQDYDIDYDYYIKNAQELINKVEKAGNKKITDPNQLSLF